MKWSQHCAHCGYAMSQLDVVCRRCGAAPEQVPPEEEPREGQCTPAQSKHFAKPVAAPHKRRAVAPLVWLLLAGVVLLGLEVAALWYWWLQPTEQAAVALPSGGGSLTGTLPQQQADRALPPGHRLPEASSAGVPLPSGIGTLFDARPSAQVTPRIAMSNRSDSVIFFSFQGPAAVTKSIPPRGTVEFELPRGRYRIQAWFHGAPRVQTGTAVFQERTSYSSTWYIGSVYPWEVDEPLRMGDIR